MKMKNFATFSTLTALCLVGCVGSVEEMTTIPVNIPATKSALQIIHKERHNTGGFSALSLSTDCSSLITISDYSQVENAKLDQPVRRSGWYQAEIIFNRDGSLNDLVFNQKGQLKDIDGSIMMGAAESMAKAPNGYLVSFDDRGTIYRYTATTSLPNALDNIPTIAYSQKNLGDGNKGLESIALLDSNALLALWETKNDNTHSLGRILKNKGEQIDIQFLAGVSPGGATSLNDGSILILEKRWLGERGQRLRLTKIQPEQLNTNSVSFNSIITGINLLDVIAKVHSLVVVYQNGFNALQMINEG